jgi:hypothetical protein
MSAPNAEEGRPNKPRRAPRCETNSLNTIVIRIDAVGDTTIRPLRSPMYKQIRPTSKRPLPRPEPEQT